MRTQDKTIQNEMQKGNISEQGRIYPFSVFDEDIQMGEVYLFLNEEGQIVYFGLALDMTIGDDVGIYIIPEFGGDDVFMEFMENVIDMNIGIVDFIAFPKQFTKQFPEIEELGFVPMPFRQDYMYFPLY